MATKEQLIVTQRSLNTKIKSICNIMRRSNCAGAMQYVPELTWILFLRILDQIEISECEEAEALGIDFKFSVNYPYRWQDWGSPNGEKRKELQNGVLGAYFIFTNSELIPHLKSLKDKKEATPRQKVISQIMSGVERVRIDTEKNFLDVLDKVHEINNHKVDSTHMFVLSQVYEGLLLKMGEKANDGGQFFTPREIIRMMIRTIDPGLKQTIYDPACGTGGFLAQAYEYLYYKLSNSSAEDLEFIKTKTFFGREKENLIYPIALSNLVLHGIDHPNIWHGNTLTSGETYGGLFEEVPNIFDIILTNPPFGGREGTEAQTGFAYKSTSTQILFLQHVIDNLNPKDGKCAIIVDEGLMYRTDHRAFVQTKKKLLDECDLWCIVSLPNGVFTAAGAGVKTNILFFTKGKPTEKVWYYDLSDLNVRKKEPLTMEYFEEFFRLLKNKEDSNRSWSVTREEIELKNYDIKAVNPNNTQPEDNRTVISLINEIEKMEKELMLVLKQF